MQICGFEALPPDLMVALAAESARERWDEQLRSGRPRGDDHAAAWAAASLRDGVSGGTFQSIAAIIATEDAAAVTDPAVLISDAGVAAAVRRTQPDHPVPAAARAAPR